MNLPNRQCIGANALFPMLQQMASRYTNSEVDRSALIEATIFAAAEQLIIMDQKSLQRGMLEIMHGIATKDAIQAKNVPFVEARQDAGL